MPRRLGARSRAGWLVIALASLTSWGCGARTQATRRAGRVGPPGRSVKVAFVGQEIWFVAPDRRWRLDGVTKRDVVWSLDGHRLAYLKPPRDARRQRWSVVVRDEAGEPVNEFPVYRDGPPTALEFRSDRRLAYEMSTSSGPVQTGAPRLLVEHDVVSGEIVAVYRGRDFVWSPDRRAVAHVGVRAAHGDRVYVDDKRVFPRNETVRGVTVVSRLAWSPRSQGLAFLVHRQPPGSKRRRAAGRPARTTLVVVLEPDDAAGDLTWEVPPGKDPSEILQVFWVGRSRVIVGPAQLKPRFTASWQRAR